MKGIILAGGLGTRLYPLTKVVSKQLLPIYDKPMIYYPLSVLMIANIKEILIISTPKDLKYYQSLLEDGSQLGISLSYKIQEEPRGLADSFIVGESFIGNSDVALILGDNIFSGHHLNDVFNVTRKHEDKALIFAYPVTNPSEFGVVEFDSQNNVKSIEEKPILPKSHYAVPGLYFYDSGVVEIAKGMKASARGELEITDLNRMYLNDHELKVQVLTKDIVWFDTGSYKGLLEASNYIKEFQESNHQYIGCIEEIAYIKGYINSKELTELADQLSKTEYGKYLYGLLGRG